MNPRCLQQDLKDFKYFKSSLESRILIKIWRNLLNIESRLRVADPSTWIHVTHTGLEAAYTISPYGVYAISRNGILSAEYSARY